MKNYNPLKTIAKISVGMLFIANALGMVGCKQENINPDLKKNIDTTYQGTGKQIQPTPSNYFRLSFFTPSATVSTPDSVQTITSTGTTTTYVADKNGNVILSYKGTDVGAVNTQTNTNSTWASTATSILEVDTDQGKATETVVDYAPGTSSSTVSVFIKNSTQAADATYLSAAGKALSGMHFHKK